VNIILFLKNHVTGWNKSRIWWWEYLINWIPFWKIWEAEGIISPCPSTTSENTKRREKSKDRQWRPLSYFISLYKNPLYSELIPDITILLQHNYPSRFILVIIALIYPEASYYLLEKTQKPEKKALVLSLHRYDTPIEFDNDSVHTSLRDWITLWLTVGEQFLTNPETSVILTQKFSDLLSSSHGGVAKKSLARIFQFFFSEKNVILPIEKASTYSEFILSQMKIAIEEELLSMDDELKEVKEIQERDLFGI
jgi:hypothetical protein